MSEYALQCPYCGLTNKRHLPITCDEAPEAGDISLCWACREPSMFVQPATPGTALQLRALTDAERTTVMADPRVRRTLGAVMEAFQPAEAIELLRGAL